MARILIADDERSVRELVADVLEGEGHHVDTATDGEVAARRLDREAFHLLITDLRMPGLSGIDLLRKARAEHPDMEVIVLTAFGTVDSAVEAMKLGAFDYLQKPLGSPAELRLLVERALERVSLRNASEARADDSAPQLTWRAPAMATVVAALRRVAPTNATVLLSGESGTGKEVAARAIHEWSSRAKAPFVAVNCAALAPSLVESELFGHERGAFTGARERKRGRLEVADGGTLLLDEVGELDPGLQVKLLRVLQERRFERVGGTQTVEVDVRIVAATNRDLPRLVESGSFRLDLYHRIAVFPIHLPPLRERPEDLQPLADALLARAARALGRGRLTLTDEARQWLAAQRWPGNIRELANALERAAILADGALVDTPHLSMLGPAIPSATPKEQPLALEELERDAIERALARVDGNRRKAAELLGIAERTLYDRLKRFGIG
ncbi:MAG: sigma-54-dependent Fis family transcriptional regulator [Myxococcales bacterium]